MNIKLKSFAFEGIKNIDKELEITFISKKKIQNDELDTSYITALYGPNGAGKSAFVEAMMLYKEVALKKSCLLKHADYIKEYRNINSKNIILRATFLVQSNRYKTAEEISHTIVINDELQIELEKIERKSKVLNVLKGEFENTNIIKKKAQFKFANLLIDSSVVALALPMLKEEEEIFGNFNEVLISLAIGVLNISMFIEDKDNNFAEMFIRKNNDDMNEDILKNALSKNMKRQSNIIDVAIIPDGDQKKFQEHWNKIIKFIKIAKPQISGVSISFEKITDTEVKPTVLLDYGNYKINVFSESVGILKLINIFDELHRLVNEASILVIDEFDAHLHDVLITEILKYFISNEEGQLIFTTHNILFMDELKNQKNAIQFLDLEGNIHVWSRNGNSSPEKAYLSGLLTNDFKYGIFDFDEVLIDE